MLQPPAIPEDMELDSSDNSDNGDTSLPGPAPPAPMGTTTVSPGDAPIAPMSSEPPGAAPMATMSSIERDEPVGQTGVPASSQVNGDGVEGTGPGGSQAADSKPSGSHRHDEDEISYEPTRTPRSTRSGKARSGGSAAKISTRTRTSTRKSAKPPNPSFKSRTRAKQPEDTKPEEPILVPDPISSRSHPKRKPEPDTEPEPAKPPSLDFEVFIHPIPPQAAQEYKPIPPGDEIYRILEKISTGVPGELWLSVEFEDGRVDQVS